MRPHVGSDGRALRESPVANLTAEWFLAGMSPYVSRQICRLTEGLVTVTASVRPLARMGPHMRLERAGPGVSLAAHPAQIGFALAGSSSADAAPAAARHSTSARCQFSVVFDYRSQSRHGSGAAAVLFCVDGTFFHHRHRTATPDSRISFRVAGIAVLLCRRRFGFCVIFAAASATEWTGRRLFELFEFVETRGVRSRSPIAGQTVARCRGRCKRCRVNIGIV